MADYNILMISPRRTGKSSTLASMQYNFDKVCAGTKITISPDESVKSLIDEKSKSLSDIISDHQDGEPFEIDENSTSNLEEYTYYLESGDSGIKHNLHFLDINGEMIYNDHEIDRLKEKIGSSKVIIIAIDTPHLMEDEGSYNDSFNDPDTIEKLLHSFTEKEPHKLIMLVPVKCEKYYYENRMDEVNLQVKEKYKGLLEEYRLNDYVKDKYTVAITPILTAGGIVFHDFERDEEGFAKIIEDSNNPGLFSRPIKALYKVYSDNPTFCPKYCEQPVLYLLNFILKIGSKFEKKEERRSAKKDGKVKKKKEKGTGNKKIKRVIETAAAIAFLIATGTILFTDKQFWEELLGDRNLIKEASKIKDKIKTTGDGYEIIQNPF